MNAQFEEQAEGLFAKFTAKLAAMDLSATASLAAVVGVSVALAGVAMEQQGQLHLLQHAGIAAHDGYKAAMAAMNLTPVEWLKEGLLGKLQSFGGNVQARGIALMAAAPMLSSAAVMLARGFVKLEESLHSQRERLVEIAGDLPVPARVGHAEMLAHIAADRQVAIRDLVFQQTAVLDTAAATTVCKVGSSYWAEMEHQVQVLHHLAHEKGLDSSRLYVAGGTVFEEGGDLPSPREVTKVGASDWKLAEHNKIFADLEHLISDAPAVDHGHIQTRTPSMRM